MEDRRRFLRRALGIGAAVAVLATPLGSIDERLNGASTQERTGQSTVYADPKQKAFDELWNMMLEYNNVRNESLQNGLSDKERERAWDDIIRYNNNNVREIDFYKCTFNEMRDFFERHNKYFGNDLSIGDPKVNSLTLGEIVDRWEEEFYWRGKNPNDADRSLRYKVVLFRQVGNNIDDVRKDQRRNAVWDKDSKTAYINVTNIEKDAESIYNNRKNMDLDRPLDFEQHMQKEVYEFVKNRCKAGGLSYEMLSEDKKREMFKKVYTSLAIRSHINHEKMHNWFPQSENPYDEAETYLFQAQDGFNSYVFWTTSRGFQRFYSAFENQTDNDSAGYSKNRLMTMAPADRAEIAKKILGN